MPCLIEVGDTSLVIREWISAIVASWRVSGTGHPSVDLALLSNEAASRSEQDLVRLACGVTASRPCVGRPPGWADAQRSAMTRVNKPFAALVDSTFPALLISTRD